MQQELVTRVTSARVVRYHHQALSPQPRDSMLPRKVPFVLFFNKERSRGGANVARMLDYTLRGSYMVLVYASVRDGWTCGSSVCGRDLTQRKDDRMQGRG